MRPRVSKVSKQIFCAVCHKRKQLSYGIKPSDTGTGLSINTVSTFIIYLRKYIINIYVTYIR